ncbi:hypothetical protein Bca101_082574 [Brassica carinata]
MRGGSPEDLRESTESKGKNGFEVEGKIKGDCLTYCKVPISGNKGGFVGLDEEDEEAWGVLGRETEATGGVKGTGIVCWEVKSKELQLAEVECSGDSSLPPRVVAPLRHIKMQSLILEHRLNTSLSLFLMIVLVEKREHMVSS